VSNNIFLMKLRKEQNPREIQRKPLRTILAATVLVSNLMGCAAFDAPRRTETYCTSKGMAMYEPRMEENPNLTPEDREFLLRNSHTHMRCVTVPAR
jgi:hypothetical protein